MVCVRPFASLLVVLCLLVPGLSLAFAAGASPDPEAWYPRASPAGAPVQSVGGSENVLVASTWGLGTYKSNNGGVTWDEILGFPINEAQVTWDPTDPDIGYVAGFGGLARTADAAESWDLVFDLSNVQRVSVSPSGTVAISARDSGTQYLRISYDQGLTWTERTSPLPAFGSAYALVFGATDADLTMLTIARTYVSHDGGLSWSEQGVGGRDLVRDGNGDLWRASNDGLDRSSDSGDTWTAVSSPHFFHRLVGLPGGGIFGAGWNGVHTTTDGTTWTFVDDGDIAFAAMDLTVDPRDPSAVFMTDESIGIMRYAPDGNGGYYVEGRTTGLPPVDLSLVTGSPDGSVLLAGGSLGLYASRDGGVSWGHTGAGLGFGGVDAAGTGVDGTVLYAGGANRVFQPIIQASPDGGRTWHFSQIGSNDGKVLGFATDPVDPLVGWAAVWVELAPSQVVQTTDGGLSWHVVFETDEKVYDVAFDVASGSLQVATGLGVVSVVPGLPTGVPGTVAPLGTTSLATHGGRTYATGQGINVWRSAPDTNPLATAAYQPYATAGPFAARLSVNDAGVWMVDDQGSMFHCLAAGDDVLGVCADDAVPVPAVDVFAFGDEAWAATPADGLFARTTA